jgi:16S rRNA (adenine1518-N6/adenine1519-N6)-dimethyltransferase
MSGAPAPPLRDVLTAAGITADKRLGQHFLLDLNICRKIARLAGPTHASTVVEIGPGPGGLTRALIETGARVIVIEKDPRFIPVLEAMARESDGRLTVVQGDALEVNQGALVPADGTARVVANLPYNVGTPLLAHWLTGPFRPGSMTLMFQKEVAERIVAAPGSPHYGRLAILAQALCQARIVMDLPARAFTPPPKVASAVVRLDALPAPPPDDVVQSLRTVARSAFGQRRKMLRSSLKHLGADDLCRDADIDPSARAETVPVAGFLSLAEAWMRRQQA